MAGKGKSGPASIYTQELGEEICRRMMEGESVRQICKDENMPHRNTLLNWLLVPDHPFAAMYDRARKLQAEMMADELLEIADDGSNDWMERENGGYVFNTEHYGRSRLRVDTRKWILSKMLPKFADKVIQEHTGTIEHSVREVMDIEALNAALGDTDDKSAVH